MGSQADGRSAPHTPVPIHSSTPLIRAPAHTSTPGYRTKQERIAIAGVDDLVIRSLADRQQFFRSARRSGSHGHLLRCVAVVRSAVALRCAPGGAPRAQAGPCRRADPGGRLRARPGEPRRPSPRCRRHRQRPAPSGGEFPRGEPAAERSGADEVSARRLERPGIAAGAGRCARRFASSEGQYDLIIGSDLLYERDADAALAGFIARHASPAGEVWIVDPDRGNRPAFNRQMADEGFLLREERLDTPASGSAAAYKGRLLVYRRAP